MGKRLDINYAPPKYTGYFVLNENGSRMAENDLFGNVKEVVIYGYTRKSVLHNAKRMYGKGVSVTPRRA